MTKQVTAALEDTSAFTPAEANHPETLGVLWVRKQSPTSSNARCATPTTCCSGRLDADKCGNCR